MASFQFNKESYIFMVQSLQEVCFDEQICSKLSKHMMSLQEDEILNAIKNTWEKEKSKLLVIVTNQKDLINAYNFKLANVPVCELKLSLSAEDWNILIRHIKKTLCLPFKSMRAPEGGDSAKDDMGEVTDDFGKMFKSLEESGAMNNIMQNAQNMIQGLGNGEKLDISKMMSTIASSMPKNN